MSALDRALAAYGLSTARPATSGLINETYLAADEGGATGAVLQRLHPVFAAEVNIDIDAVTAHLEAAGVPTPRLLRTQSGARWIEVDGAVWRAISYVDGVSMDHFDNPAQAEVAAGLVARFHRAAQTLDHEFVFTRSGVHDTPAHLRRLEAAEAGTFHERDEAEALRARILEGAAALPTLADDLPRRICHGDLKVSNVLFDAARQQALCLVDLDTVGRQIMAYELGDMLRSWCNPNRFGEDAADLAPNMEILRAALRGYAPGAADLLNDTEVESIASGFEIVTIELAARFCVDVFEDHYFGWDSTRFASRREHNLLRARGQLTLGTAIGERRETIAQIIRSSFAAARR